jgi:uncharacterized RDD family membrane protein YckC
MILCPSCGTENADGMRFCVKCGGTIADSSPSPGSWQQPSGNLYDTPTTGGGSAPGTGGGFTGQPGTYAPPPVSYGGGYGTAGAMTSTGFGGLPYAEWIDRVLAALIDGGIAAGVMIVLYIIFGVIGGVLGAIGSSMSSDAGSAIGSLSCCFGFLLAGLSVFVVGIYNKVFLVSKRGFSIGQGVMKLKVVDAMGNIPQMGTLIIRLLAQVAMGFIPVIGIFLGIANALWPLWDEKKQTLHDKAAGTFVLKTGA